MPGRRREDGVEGREVAWLPGLEGVLDHLDVGEGGEVGPSRRNQRRTEPERLARLARLRWLIELDYRQLKGELGLDHYEGRSYLGFHHHCTLVTAAHGFLTLERADPNHQRPG